MNINKDLKKEPFPSGVFVFAGEQGAGKTSLGAALFCEDYKKWRKERRTKAEELAQRFYADSGVKLDISDRVYFSNVEFVLNKRHKLSTHYVDVQRLGLPNPDYQVQYLPRGSMVYIQEGDILLFCQDNKTLSKYLIDLCKYVRHMGLTVIIDCQVFGRIDKSIRSLSMGIYYITESYDSRFFFFWKRRKWKFFYIRNQLNEVVKELATVGVHIKVSVVEKGKFKFRGNIFERYDSFSAEAYFLDGIEKVGYEYLEYPKKSLSLEAIKEYIEAHPLERPEIMERKTKKDKEKEKDEEKSELPTAKPKIVRKLLQPRK